MQYLCQANGPPPGVPKDIAVNLLPAEWALPKEKRMDHRELLSNFYLFTDAGVNDLRALQAIGEPNVCIAGDLVYSEGEVADALFLIEMGTVDIMPRGKETVFVTMGSGQGFGELSFFERGPRPAAAYAREPTHLLRISYERLSQVLAERPKLALLVYRNACIFFAKHLHRMALNLNHRYL
jgi:CRP-like cAMP-binding protein